MNMSVFTRVYVRVCACGLNIGSGSCVRLHLRFSELRLSRYGIAIEVGDILHP